MWTCVNLVGKGGVVGSNWVAVVQSLTHSHASPPLPPLPPPPPPNLLLQHGKSTLADALVSKGGFLSKDKAGSACVLDNNDIEKEKGITMYVIIISRKRHRD
jgi:hypothetical protein